MLTAVFAFVVGMGIGAFNAETLQPCLADTLHISRQKAAPAAKRLSQTVRSKTGEFSEVVAAKTNDIVARAKDKYQEVQQKRAA
mmetsp:Transcript_123209/g.344890  ORF Transcript_123209/g.344890 Transcript_123209/m.344890 type:complete len:84 (+) Transcript_123209:88-339(+)